VKSRRVSFVAFLVANENKTTAISSRGETTEERACGAYGVDIIRSSTSCGSAETETLLL